MGEDKRYREIWKGLEEAKVRVVTFVPDSLIGPLLLEIQAHPAFRAVQACSEEEAIAIAAGAALAGERSASIFQNAGLFSSGRAVSLAQVYHVPLLLLIGYRGDHRDPVPYHIYKGKATEPLLRALGVAYALAHPSEPLARQVVQAVEYVQTANQPIALLLSRTELK